MTRRSMRAATSWGALVATAGLLVGCATVGDDPVALGGTQWEVMAIHDGRQDLVGVQPGTRVTLDFDEAGRVGGSAGCNRYSARVEAGAGRLRVDAPSATRMACAEPGVMAQEQAFLRALAAVRAAHVDAGRLALRDADGRLVVSARAVPKAP